MLTRHEVSHIVQQLAASLEAHLSGALSTDERSKAWAMILAAHGIDPDAINANDIETLNAGFDMTRAGDDTGG